MQHVIITSPPKLTQQFIILGGPLFCQSKVGVYTFHGVYSWGRCGSHDNKPAVYTRVSYFKNWMNRVIKNSTMTD